MTNVLAADQYCAVYDDPDNIQPQSICDYSTLAACQAEHGVEPDPNADPEYYGCTKRIGGGNLPIDENHLPEGVNIETLPQWCKDYSSACDWDAGWRGRIDGYRTECERDRWFDHEGERNKCKYYERDENNESTEDDAGFFACGIPEDRPPMSLCNQFCYIKIGNRSDILNTSGSFSSICEDSRQECLDRVQGPLEHAPNEVRPGYCGTDPTQHPTLGDKVDDGFGSTYEGQGSFTGGGISAAFKLDGFKPFENVEGLYVRDGETASIPQFINTFLGFIIGISGAAVVVIIVVSGFQYVTAAAGASKTASKERVTEALIGLVILLCSVAILNTINPRLLNLDQLEPIEVNITQQEFEGGRTGYGGGGSSAPGGVPDDLYRDSTNIQCADGTTDAGIETGYYRGQSYEIRLCELSNIRDVSGGDNGSKVLVNSRISGNVQAMVDAMIADGLNPSVRDSFRTNEAQRRLYNSNCNSRGCNPPTARPGYSRHQSGNALDITTGGPNDTVMRGGCQTRPGVETWVWLNENASRFQMKQLCSEAWHWSPDGH